MSKNCKQAYYGLTFCTHRV